MSESIRWSKGLTKKPEVISIASDLSIKPQEAAGYLMYLWEWCDDHITGDNIGSDGSASIRLGANPEKVIDGIVGAHGFASAMVSAGWISLSPPMAVFPNFERHNCRHKRTASSGSEATATTNIHGYSEDFEVFWELFPKLRRKAKQTAWRAWIAAIKTVNVDTIMSALREYADSDEAKGQYVPMPSTWLNSRRWEDERSSWNAKSQTLADPRGTIAAANEYISRRKQ